MRLEKRIERAETQTHHDAGVLDAFKGGTLCYEDAEGLHYDIFRSLLRNGGRRRCTDISRAHPYISITLIIQGRQADHLLKRDTSSHYLLLTSTDGYGSKMESLFLSGRASTAEVQAQSAAYLGIMRIRSWMGSPWQSRTWYQQKRSKGDVIGRGTGDLQEGMRG